MATTITLSPSILEAKYNTTSLEKIKYNETVVWTKPQEPTIVFTPATGSVFAETQSVTITTTNADGATYSINNGTAVAFVGSTTVSLSATSILSVTAINESYSVTKNAVFTKVGTPTITFSPASGTTFSTSSQEVTITTTNADSATYKVGNGTAVSFTNSTKVTISATSTISVTATNTATSTTKSASYTKKVLNYTVKTNLGTTTYSDGIVPDMAYDRNYNITSVVLGNGITQINMNAFWLDSGIKTLDLGEVQKIGKSAFEGCTGLTSVKLPSTLTSISDAAFSSCSNVTSISYAGTKAQWAKVTKATYWCLMLGTSTLKCTDGNVTLSTSW